MANITTAKSDLYIPPKVSDLYPQLGNTGDQTFLSANQTATPVDIDEATGQRKYFRFVVDKPVCVTILGLDNSGLTLIVDQIFGPPSCEDRKNLLRPEFDSATGVTTRAQINFTDTECQRVFTKPGRYEIYEAGMDLWPLDAEVVMRTIDTNTARLLGEHGSVIDL